MAERDDVPCYLATCPVCHGVVMIAVADVSNLVMMQHALKARRECERDGLPVETMPVSVGRERLQKQFGHVTDCANDPKNKRKLKRANRQAALALSAPLSAR